MVEFHGLLTFETSALPESDREKETLPDAVRCGHSSYCDHQLLNSCHADHQRPSHPQMKGAVCANINLLMEKEEEDFEKYLSIFAVDIWTLLTSISLEQRQVWSSARHQSHGGTSCSRHASANRSIWWRPRARRQRG